MKTLDGKVTIRFPSSWGILENNPGNELADLRIQKIRIMENRDGRYIPTASYWIPGSSLKGTLRHAALNIDPESCGEVHTNNKRQNCSKGQPCRVCSLFGNYNREGKVRMSSILLPNADTVLQSHVSILRSKRAASSGGLFHVERLAPLEASTHIFARDLTSDEEKLLNAALMVWGNMGLGRKHELFEVSADLGTVEKGGYLE